MTVAKAAIAVVSLLSACETTSLSPQNLLATAPAPLSTPSPLFSSSPVPLAIAPLPEAPRPQQRPAGEVAFIKAQLNALQPRSIAENREYCGYLGLTPAGAYAISPPVRGDGSGCRPDNPPESLRIIASYHTHAAYAPRYDSEAPSAQDVEGDISEGVNGYISTPGGRLWFVDGRAQEAVLLCGLDCVASDPRFQPDADFPIRTIFTLSALRARLR